MLNDQELEQRRMLISTSTDLRQLLSSLGERAQPVLQRQAIIPAVKALLSKDGGFCPIDASALIFDPWSPDAHRCPRCGQVFTGDRHHRWWARLQHLWVAERIAHLAAIATLGDDARAGAECRRLLVEYAARYLDYPNQDNVLGPSRLFFSTYLESIWVTSIISAALLLRAAGQLDQATADAVDLIANEAANLIADYNEGMSNRQTWNNAALAGLAVWFEDEELLLSTVQSPSGLVAHLHHGFGSDGMWAEGENYHLFALRGLLIGLRFMRSAGIDPLEEESLADQLERILRAPMLTALPDLTFPARKDSRFGVSLAQPMYLDNWEVGFGTLGSEGALGGWLSALYAAPAPPALPLESYLHEAGLPAPDRRRREDLSWWCLVTALPDIDRASQSPARDTVFLAEQGLAVLRSGDRYASVECGTLGGGHGHPDRLHLTLHQDGVHWLPDPGTGSYVNPDLFWYRSTLAHNAPRIDGISQVPGDATCDYFDLADDWSWVSGWFGDASRAVISGPDHLLDIVEMTSGERRLLELPWHLAGEWEVVSPGRWEPSTLESEFVSDVTRFVPDGDAAVQVVARSGTATLSLAILGAGDLVRAVGPGVPGSPPAAFLVARASGHMVRLVTAIVRGDQPPGLSQEGDVVTVQVGGNTWTHQPTMQGRQVEGGSTVVKLGGHLATGDRIASADMHSTSEAFAEAIAVPEPPGDVSLTGVEPMLLDREDQYRRSEEPWAGDGTFTASCWAAWSEHALSLTIDVVKPDVWFRPADAPPLLFDNEPDDIHSDGVQAYMQPFSDGPVYGFLVVPQGDGSLRVRGAGGTDGAPGMVEGSWERTGEGYRIDLEIHLPGWEEVMPGAAIGFDLIVNEMRPGRQRRAGQLVWSGDGGWLWLRGDRHEPSRFGRLEMGPS